MRNEHAMVEGTHEKQHFMRISPPNPVPGNGRIIALEGLDGCGTTTQAARLIERLSSEGFSPLSTCEPSTGPIGLIIRKVLGGDPELQHSNAASLALLFAADRLEHYGRLVEPALRKNQIVVTDRSVWSSLAYQGLDLAPEWVASINGAAVLPHVAILVDVPAHLCMERIAARSDQRERFERLETLKALQTRYNDLFHAEHADATMLRVDGTSSPEEVHEAIWQILVDGNHLPF
ncbi:MAG: dTMP kinase [Myxococcales bacterium]|nr:dTMP kinase [Myxococcales bacterium]|tara:strand:+ start:3112 stop:3813 length:702 start_codon:yes stop_codon:yes gene_type:complete